METDDPLWGNGRKKKYMGGLFTILVGIIYLKKINK